MSRSALASTRPTEMDAAFETAGGKGAPAAVVKLGDLTRVEIKLSRTEFAILRVLAQHAGRIITYSQLLREIGRAHV